MNISELPQEWQDKLAADRKELSGKKTDTPYEMYYVNADGTRFFRARRVCHPWNDDRGHSMKFGNGTHWKVSYGAVQFRAVRNVMGEREYALCDGKTYGRSANGTEIPSRLGTKKEVRELLVKIGIFV